MSPALLRAVFFDRDGTLTREGEWLRHPSELELVPGVGAALARLHAAGLKLVMVTNQSAVARGLITLAELDLIHDHLRALLAQDGGVLDGIYSCPHHPTEGIAPFRRECDCRKPKPGLVLQAARELGLDCHASWMVGDAARDLEAGWAAGTRGILVATGKGQTEREVLLARGTPPDAYVADVPAAAELILRELAQGK